MQSVARIFLGLALLMEGSSLAADGVAPYTPPPLTVIHGQATYPPGVSDPSQGNPPAPPLDRAIPTPPIGDPPSNFPGWPETPLGSVSPMPGQPAGPIAAPPVWSPRGVGDPNPSASGVVSAAWNSPSVAPAQVYAPLPAVPPSLATWYTRVEYFHWNERIGSTDFVNEDGTLFTLGYSRQIGIERFRAELFGGDVHYDGYDDANMAPLSSNTGYLGLRGEYELVLAPASWEGRWAVLAGLGTRFWIRDLHDGTDALGNPVYGYQETWWTMYPFLGLESHLPVGDGLELYSESRVGATAATYQFVSINYRPLWPKAGLLANTELGLRGPRFFVAARAEVMSWAQSSVVEGSYQPDSLMVTVGGRLGFMF